VWGGGGWGKRESIKTSKQCYWLQHIRHALALACWESYITPKHESGILKFGDLVSFCYSPPVVTSHLRQSTRRNCEVIAGAGGDVANTVTCLLQCDM